VESAWGATRKKDGFLKQKYIRLIKRKGKKKALVAVGHSIIKASYFILKDKVCYHPQPVKEAEERKERQVQYYLNKLKKLGIEMYKKTA
jgi:hypothetical protein